MTNWDRFHIEAQSVAVHCIVAWLVFYPLNEGLSRTYGKHTVFALVWLPAMYCALRVQSWYRSRELRRYNRRLGCER